MHPNIHGSTIYNSQDMEAMDGARWPSTKEWMMWYIYTMEYYSIKLSHLQRCGWTQDCSEVSQKEKNILCITHICGIYKNSTDDLICKADIETQRQRIYGYQEEKRDEEGGVEIGIGIYAILILCIKQVTNENQQHRELYLMHCEDLNGKKVQKGGNICICVTDPLCYTVEANTTL